jgi:hypothetical protein
MKKILLPILFIQALYVAAQPSFGITGGASFSNIITRDVPAQVQYGERTYAPGLYFGVFGMLKIAEKISFTPELLFTQRGWKELEPGRPKKTIRFNYVEIPLLISCTLHKKFNLEAGPNVSYLISGENNFDEFYKKLDFGINGGGQFQLTNSLSMTLRYYKGLRSLTEITFMDINGNIIGESKEFSQCFQVGVNYTLR